MRERTNRRLRMVIPHKLQGRGLSGLGLAVAALAMAQMSAAPAQAACTTVAPFPALTTITCDGEIVHSVAGPAIGASVGASDLHINSSATVTTSANSSDAIKATTTNGNIVIDNSGAITASNTMADGIVASATGPGAVSILSQAPIEVQGFNAYGVSAFAADGPLTINVFGPLVTKGEFGGGVYAQTNTGAIDLTVSADVTTENRSSDGISAYTRDGGNINVTVTGDVMASGAGAEAIEASTREGDVTIDVSGDITAMGHNAMGIGGYVDYSGNVQITASGDIEVASYGIFTVARNGNVGVTLLGDIVSMESDAWGIYAETTTGNVTIAASGDVTTNGDDAPAIEALTEEGSIAVTASGAISTLGNRSSGISAIASDSGFVSVIATGSVSTKGDESSGIVAQTDDGSVSIDASGDVKTEGLFATGIRAYAGDGGSVEITSSGKVLTSGNFASGIYATADGYASLDLSGTITTFGLGTAGAAASSSYGDVGIVSAGDIAVHGEESVGLSASTGYGERATLDVSGSVSATGLYSTGISLSTSHGLADLDMSGSVAVSGNSSYGIYGGSYAGHVRADVSGDVLASGRYSYGIYLYTEAGDDDDDDVTTALSSLDGDDEDYAPIDLDVSGSVIASGTESTAVRAVAYNGTAYLDISGDILADGEESAAVSVAAANSDIEVEGSIRAVNGCAICVSGGSIEVYNYGLISGNIVLAADGVAVLENGAGGLIESQGLLLGSGSLLNRGVLSPGGLNDINWSKLDGSLAQQSSGILLVDAEWISGNADRIEGYDGDDSAYLNGFVVVNPINFAATGGLTRTFTIVDLAGGEVTDGGLEAVDTAAVDYELEFLPSVVNLTATINFLGSGGSLSGNQQAVGSSLNSIAGGGLAFVPTLLTLDSDQQLAEALGQLAPLGDAGTNAAAIATGNTFAGQMLSCRVLGDDGEAFIREGQCLWARATARTTDTDGGDDDAGFEESSTFYSAGIQLNVGGPWRIGGAVGFEDLTLDAGNNARSDGERLHIGGIVKYNPGPWLLAASVTGGRGWFDNERRVTFGGFDARATSESDTSFVSGRLTAAYLASFGSWYLKPQVETAVTWLGRDGYTESGTGGVALDVHSSDDTVVSVSPMLEIGAEFGLAQGGVARPYLRAGVTWLDTDEFATTAEFADVAGAGTPFTIKAEVDDVLADIGTGVDFIGRSGTVLRLQYDGRFGEDTTQHGGTAKLSVPF